MNPLSADHPRACGENARKLFRERLGLGSPPRMRGKRLCPPCVVGFARITPAHAGKTEGHVRRSGGNADHPRACGENPKTFAASGTVIGSPPRMRGKRLQPGRRELRVRITPAHAGKTPASMSALMSSADHPRACGENSANEYMETATSGSPPRMRGKLGLCAV